MQSLPDLRDNTKMPHSLILVDDAASDASREFIHQINIPSAQWHAAVHLGSHGERANALSDNWNIGIDKAGFDTEYGQEYLVILNNDIAFPPLKDGKCWLERLVDLGDRYPDYAWISPYWHWTGDIETDPNAKASYKNSVHAYTDKHAGNIDDGGIGCFFMMRMSAVKKLAEIEKGQPYAGKFDAANFPCQWEEVDYLLRLRRAGFKTGIFHEVALCHKGSGTIASKEWHGKIQPEYRVGMSNFLRKYNLPTSVGQFTVSHGIYKYRVGQKWHEVGGQDETS